MSDKEGRLRLLADLLGESTQRNKDLEDERDRLRKQLFEARQQRDDAREDLAAVARQREDWRRSHDIELRAHVATRDQLTLLRRRIRTIISLSETDDPGAP
jgi:predicted  nucleic acid-binding Zn-ribbon protein